MISLVAAVLLSAAPRPHPAAHLAIYLPRMDKLNEVTAFMRLAGQRTAMLNPNSWRNELNPVVPLDLTDPASLLASGLDPAGSLTLSYVGDARVSCTTLKDPKRFEEKAALRLANAGEPWKSTAGGVPLVGASSAGRVLLGYALKGKEACAVQGQGGNVSVILTQAAKAVLKPASGPEWKRAASLPGAVFVVSRFGVAGLKGGPRSLTAEARTTRVPLPPLEPAGPSPFAGVAPGGLAFLRAKVSPEGRKAMERTLLAQLLDVCGACDPAEMGKVADALLPRLTGDALLRVDRVKVAETLRTGAGRYFALKHAWVVEVDDPVAAKAALQPLDSWKAAKKTAEGWALSVRGGEVLIGIRGTHLYLSNDGVAVTAALLGLDGKAGRLPHGAEWVLDPGLVARGLAQIPLFDVLGSQELAALFAAGTELGPLLSASERISGWADSAGDGSHRAQGTWVLKPPPGPKGKIDAGAADAGTSPPPGG